MPCSPDPGHSPIDGRVEEWRRRLDCAFDPVQSIFADCLAAAEERMGKDGLAAYIDAARLLCKLGRGAEPVLAFLEGWPATGQLLGQDSLEIVLAWVRTIQRTPNGDVLGAFFQALPATAASLGSAELLESYLELLTEVARRSSASLHRRHAILPSRALPELIRMAPQLLRHVNLQGLREWARHGLHHYANNPERQADYFAMQSADSRALFQSQRHGTLLRTHERSLDLYLRALWDEPVALISYSEVFDQLRRPQPYADARGFHLPDLRVDREGVCGLDQYRLTLAHLAAHGRFSRSLAADNVSPFHRLCVETLEDARVDTLLLKRFPGLRRPLLALHPNPSLPKSRPIHRFFTW